MIYMNFLTNIGTKELNHSAGILTRGEKMKLSKKVQKLKSYIYNNKFVAAKAMVEDEPKLIWKISSAQRNKLWQND